MRLISTLALAALALPSAVSAQGAPVVFHPHHPPAAAGTETMLLDPRPEVRCGNVAVAPVRAFDLPPQAGAAHAPGGQPVSIRFTLDSEGRALNITGGDAAAQAALAGLRFPAEARSGCVLEISYAPVPLDQAPLDLLARYYAVTRTSGRVRQAVQAKLASPGRDCRPLRAPKTVSHPDFRIGATPPGGQDWTVVRWNIDAQGRSTGVETLASSGDAAFDAEARRAIAETVVREGEAVTGCVYNVFRRGAALPAPERAPAPDDRLAACPEAAARRFRPGPDAYPEPFRRRGVEGWALVRFDLASWGQVGAVHVLEAQPASAFGDAARTMVARGRAEPGFDGAVRCVVPIVFRMPGGGASDGQ